MKLPPMHGDANVRVKFYVEDDDSEHYVIDAYVDNHANESTVIAVYASTWGRYREVDFPEEYADKIGLLIADAGAEIEPEDLDGIDETPYDDLTNDLKGYR